MKIIRFILFVWAATGAIAFADETWQGALSQMPLNASATELNRTNCVPLMLDSFQPSGTVKALIFMPGATDEIYFFKRARSTLTNSNPSLLDAVIALTNQTYIQAAFRPPLLLLYTTEDALDGFATIKNDSTAAKLRETPLPGHFTFNDGDWDAVLAKLHKKFSIRLQPSRGSAGSWHFYRHCFSASDLTEWEMLESLALAGKTTFTVHWRTVDFQPDARHGIVPKLEKFPGT
jgi:hypothetical protein